MIAAALAMPIVTIFMRSLSREVSIQIWTTWLVLFATFAICLCLNYRRRKRAEVQAGKLVWAISIRPRFVLLQIFPVFFALYLSSSLTYYAAMSSKVAFANLMVFPVWTMHVFAALIGSTAASRIHWSWFGGFETKEFRENGTLTGQFFTSWKYYREIELRTTADKTQLYFPTRARKIRFGIIGRARYCRASHWKLDLPPNLRNEADRIVQSLNDARMRSTL